MNNPLFNNRYLRIIICGIYIVISPILFASASNNAKADSLKSLLSTCKDRQRRIEIYVHLSDIYTKNKEENLKYWEKALDEAIIVQNKPIMRLAFDALVRKNSSKNPEKASTYIELANKNLPEKEYNLFHSYLYICNIWLRMQVENSVDVVNRELEKLKKENITDATPEKQIEWEFLTGLSIDFSSTASGAYTNIRKAIPYIENVQKLLSHYPLDQKIELEELCYTELTSLHTLAENKKAIEDIQYRIKLKKQKIQENIGFKRVFYNESISEMSMYSSMIYLGDLITKEQATEYYQKFENLARSNKVLDEFFDTSTLYYFRIGDYKKALAYVDSAIVYYKEHYSPITLVPVYTIKSKIYKELGDYKNAYINTKICDSIRESTRSEDGQQKMAEMQARFELNKLELEKISLSNRNKQIALIAALTFILLIVSWGIYQRIMVKRLKQVQQKLIKSREEAYRQSQKATESEKMKTAFINSMCHEIRTPLNAINGFTSLIFDKTIDESIKADLPKLVQENTDKLTGLLDTLLELSHLISSDDALPVEKINLHDILVQEISLRKARSQKISIEYILECDEENSTFDTNEHYLSLVIRNLLENAEKFTEAGKITLCCLEDTEKHQMQISVADTGIGISPEQQEWVFERFTKINEFQAGTGLGLYLCRTIVNRLNGTIQVDSTYTSGCKILIILPMK